MRNQLKAPKGIVLFAALCLPVLIYVTVSIIPILIGLYNSFFRDLDKRWIGFANYQKLLGDSAFWGSVLNTLRITAIALVGQVGLGFLVALMLSSGTVLLRKLHRTVIFFPVMLSTVVIGLLWMMVYNSQSGLLNEFLRLIGRPSWIAKWLDDPRIVLYSVSVPVVWQYIGLYMVILMSSIESIPKEIIESSKIDGANNTQRTYFITIPMTYDTIKVAITLCIAGTLKIFDHIFVMTGGGPGNTSSVMSLYAYKISFIRMNMSYGNTIAVCVLLISLGIVLISRKLMGGKRYE